MYTHIIFLCYHIHSILEQIEFSAKKVSRQLQLRAQVELKILSIYLQLGTPFPLVKWSHNDLFWPIMCIIFSVKWIFLLRVPLVVDTDLHFCVLTPDPIAEGTNQHTVYHSVSCCKLQLSVLSKVFLYFTVIFHPKGKQSVIGDFICSKLFRKWSVWILQVYCRNQHDFWWCHRQDTPLWINMTVENHISILFFFWIL